jgi:hypothetical protein
MAIPSVRTSQRQFLRIWEAMGNCRVRADLKVRAHGNPKAIPQGKTPRETADAFGRRTWEGKLIATLLEKLSGSSE